MPRQVAVQQSTRGHHLGVQPGVLGQQAMEDATVLVGPVHHRRNTQAPGVRFEVGGQRSQVKNSVKAEGPIVKPLRLLPDSSAVAQLVAHLLLQHRQDPLQATEIGIDLQSALQVFKRLLRLIELQVNLPRT